MVFLPVEFVSYGDPYKRQSLYRRQCHRPYYCNEGEISHLIPLLVGNALLQQMAGDHGCSSQRQRCQKKWIQKLNVGGFQPDEIKVNVNDQTIVVHALHIEGGGDNIDIHETKRTIKIPDNIDKEKLSSYLKAGTLIIEAPYIEKHSGGNEKSAIEKRIEETKHDEMNDATEKELHSEKEEMTKEASQIKESDESKKAKNYQMNVSLPSFHPNNIAVTSDHGTVSIKARNEYQTDGVQMSESFLRSFKLPENVDTDGLKCTMDDNGQLHITAPYRDEQLNITAPNREKQQLHITKDEPLYIKQEEQLRITKDEPLYIKQEEQFRIAKEEHQMLK